MTSNRKFRYKIILLTALLLLSVRISLIGGGSASASDITVSSVLSGVNNERSQRNISTLRTDSRLSNAAQSKSADMITRKYFAHVDPDGHYIWDKIVADGYTPYTILGENLAIDFSDTAGLIAAWIDSPTHRANLLNPDFVDQGMGVALGDTAQGQYSIAITNTFGAQPAAPQTTTPAKQTPAKPIQNTPSKPTTPTPPPTQKPQVIIKKGVTLGITNTETILHTNHFTLKGTVSTNTTVRITDSADKTSATAQPDPSGNFHYDYQNLTNGEHNFIASATVDGNTISTPVFSLKIDFSSPTIDPAKIEITAGLKNNSLDLHISGQTPTNATSITATVSNQTTNIPVDGTTFAGDINLSNPYTDLSQSSLVLGATDIYGNKSSTEIGLKGISVPTSGKNPTDLYNVFKYIVIFFGAIFTFALIGDSFFLRKKKITDLDQIGGASNYLLLLLILSTLALVRWWN